MNVDVSAYPLSIRLKLEVEVIKVKSIVPVDPEILAHTAIHDFLMAAQKVLRNTDSNIPPGRS